MAKGLMSPRRLGRTLPGLSEWRGMPRPSRQTACNIVINRANGLGGRKPWAKRSGARESAADRSHAAQIRYARPG